MVLLVGLLWPAVAWAQSGGGITGLVRDTTGAVLPGVTVEAASPALIEKIRTVVTDEPGPVQHRRSAARHLHRDVHPAGVQHGQAGGHRADGQLHRDRQCRSARGRALGDDHGVGAEPGGGHPERGPAARDDERGPRGAAECEIHPEPDRAHPGTLVRWNRKPGCGGTVGDMPTAVAIHGGRTSDQHLFYDGMRTNNINAVGGGGGNAIAIFFNPAAVAQEISMEIGNHSVQSETGGVVINVIPKEGGNSFTGSFLANGTNGSMQSNNLTDELRARGLTAVTKIKNIFDLNGALGGPILKDKLWFFAAYRRWGNENYVAGRYFSQDPLAWTYIPDLSRQAYEQNMHRSINGRVTWQANRTNKISFAFERQDQCVCYSGIINSFGASATRRLKRPR